MIRDICSSNSFQYKKNLQYCYDLLQSVLLFVLMLNLIKWFNLIWNFKFHVCSILNFNSLFTQNTRSLVHEVQYNYIQIALVYRWWSQKKEKQNTTNVKKRKNEYKIHGQYFVRNWPFLFIYLWNNEILNNRNIL